MPHTLHTPFQALHTTAAALSIPNAWDAASAALFAQEGASAIATSSASLAWSLGYADGGLLPREELLAAIRRIQRVIHIPLTVDLEDGYSEDPRAVAALVAEVAALGVVGINLEDGAQAYSQPVRAASPPGLRTFKQHMGMHARWRMRWWRTTAWKACLPMLWVTTR